MTFVALAVVYLGACATMGLRARRATDVAMIAVMAAGVVAAQLFLLLTR